MKKFSEIKPKISVIVPSYNQGIYLAETIESIIDQEYPNCELIVIDGGSTDNSVEIIEKYQKHIDFWVSEPDHGQCDALIKGFNRATGDIFCWLCSDDKYLPGTLKIIAENFQSNPTIDLVYGDTDYLYPDGSLVKKPRISYHYQTMLRAFNIIAQPSSFFRARIYRQIGGLDPSLDFAMDYDLFIRFGPKLNCLQLKKSLSLYRLHPSSKTVSLTKKFDDEWWRVRSKVLGRSIGLWDRLMWWLFTARVVWRFFIERGVVKITYDKRKFLNG